MEGIVRTARCRESFNVLRLECEATTDVATTLAWQLPGRLHPAITEGTDHSVVLYGADADTVVSWTATADDGRASGQVRTGPLPTEVAQVLPVVSGDAAAVAPLLFRYGCNADDGVMIVDGTGRVRWYEPLDAPPTSVAFDGRDGWLGILSRSSVYRAGLDGQLRFRTDSHPDPLHHDAFADALDRSWALTAYIGEGVVADGLAVWDVDGELLATWALTDHIDPGMGRVGSMYWEPFFPGVPDGSHGNSIWVHDDLGLVSLRWLDTVLAIEADPEAPDFGAVRWALVGSTLGTVPSDFALPPGVDFIGQHHATFTHDGRLMLFDNRLPPERSRVLQLVLDHEEGTAEVVESWSMDSHCEVQGAAYEQADGSVVATCGPSAAARVFRRGEAEAVWRMDLICALPPHRLVPRFQPVEGVFAP